MIRILVTGSRAWTDRQTIRRALAAVVREHYHPGYRLRLVHGACPTGADQVADEIWRGWMARRRAARRCGGPRPKAVGMSGLEPAVVTALLAAAEAAERAPTSEKAVRAAWSTLHHDRAAMMGAFHAWNQHVRGHTREIPELGGIVRRMCRKKGPGAVAALLRDAAGTS